MVLWVCSVKITQKGNTVSKKKTSQFTDADFVVKAVSPEVVSEPEGKAEEVTDFTIEEVEIPKRSGRKATNTFPIDKLTAGSNQSFLVPSTPEDVKKVTTRIRQFSYRNDYKVVLRTEEKGIRVWRAK